MIFLMFSSYSVSAFYAECPSKRLYVNGTVGTKTKFLGLSVKAQNSGTGACVHVHLLITYGHILHVVSDTIIDSARALLRPQ